MKHRKRLISPRVVATGEFGVEGSLMDRAKVPVIDAMLSADLAWRDGVHCDVQKPVAFGIDQPPPSASAINAKPARRFDSWMHQATAERRSIVSRVIEPRKITGLLGYEGSSALGVGLIHVPNWNFSHEKRDHNGYQGVVLGDATTKRKRPSRK
ncbi:MAG: hypothetical protein AAGI46_04945 [Planctomycetota bacterium]